MATKYLGRVQVKASNGIFTFIPGDLASARVSISNAAARVNGMTTDNTTSGFVEPNRDVTFTMNVYIRKFIAFVDFLKAVDWSQPVSIQVLEPNTTTGSDVTFMQLATLTNCIAADEDWNSPAPGTVVSQSVTFFAEDYTLSAA